jgi:hypothetical protein
VLEGEATLEPSDPQPGTLDIELAAPHLDGLASPSVQGRVNGRIS